MAKVYLLYENEQWCLPLIKALEDNNVAYEKWPLIRGGLDLNSTAPDGVFFNRMSASAHTRDHRYSPEYTSCVLAWLHSQKSHVINGSHVLQLEINKAAQLSALQQAGITTPATLIALGKDGLIEQADNLAMPFIIKHNRAGKGLGVNLINAKQQLQSYINSDDYEPPVDGLWQLQQYIKSPENAITRVEFINQKFVYAVKVDTQEGFELCPADFCETDEAYSAKDDEANQKFTIIENFHHPLIKQYERFMQLFKIDVAAFEFITDRQGNDYTYDINTNTNYNTKAEGLLGVSAMNILAQYLNGELSKLN